MAIRMNHLKFYLEQNQNVLLIGEAGVGKSAMTIELATMEKLKWKYYSAATMDPWVDFVGIPVPVKDEKSQKSHIEFAIPKELADDDVEFMFFDEFNRAHKRIRNAVMELLQFKSINGRKFKNLRCIWAAINPLQSHTGKEYDTDELDPAQLDRFQIQITVPYDCDDTYFQKKYQKYGIEAVKWWRAIPKDAQKLVSPRRLDYVLNLFDKGADINILGNVVDTTKVNLKQLITGLTMIRQAELTGSISPTLQQAISNSNIPGIIKMIAADTSNLETVKRRVSDFPGGKMIDFRNRTEVRERAACAVALTPEILAGFINDTGDKARGLLLYDFLLGAYKSVHTQDLKDQIKGQLKQLTIGDYLKRRAEVVHKIPVSEIF